MALDEPIGFEADVRPRSASTPPVDAFRLRPLVVVDVRAHAAENLQRLQAGSMPCDGARPPERIDVFRRTTDIWMPQ